MADNTPPCPDDMITVVVSKNAFIITPADNGYVLQTFPFDDNRMLTEVFEQPDGEFGEHHAILQLLWSAFEGHFQSKWRGGFRFEVRPTGREAEEAFEPPMTPADTSTSQEPRASDVSTSGRPPTPTE